MTGYLQRMHFCTKGLPATCYGISEHPGTRCGTTVCRGGQFRQSGTGKQTELCFLSAFCLQIVVDCRGHLLGRLASVLAKEFLMRV